MQTNARVLGLDYGDKRVGVAISDPLGLTAGGLPTISRKNPMDHKATIQEIGHILDKFGARTIVLGYPRNMDGTEGENCRKVQNFAKQLGKAYPHVTINFFDERLTTTYALQTLNLMGAGPDVKRKNVDKLAAQLILQGYLDYTPIKEKEIMANDKNLNENLDNLEDVEVETIVMTDDEGNEIEYIIIDEFEKDGTNFLIMIDFEKIEDEDVEAVIFKQIGDEDENLVFEEISEDDYEMLEPILKERLEDFDFE